METQYVYIRHKSSKMLSLYGDVTNVPLTLFELNVIYIYNYLCYLYIHINVYIQTKKHT